MIFIQHDNEILPAHVNIKLRIEQIKPKPSKLNECYKIQKILISKKQTRSAFLTKRHPFVDDVWKCFDYEQNAAQTRAGKKEQGSSRRRRRRSRTKKTHRVKMKSVKSSGRRVSVLRTVCNLIQSNTDTRINRMTPISEYIHIYRC